MRLGVVVRMLAVSRAACTRSLSLQQSWSSASTSASSSCGTVSRLCQSGPLQVRSFAADAQHHAHEVDEINALFVEAREEIEYAAEDSETVYFNDSVAEAKVVVDRCTDKWAALLAKLPDDERARMQRSMGLKIEQLKAEFEILAATHS